MGFLDTLLGRRRADPGTGGWEPDGRGVEAYEGDEDSGADRGAAYSTGFTNPYLPGRAITVAYYPVFTGEGWAVERRVEWSIAGDPSAEPWFYDSDTGLMTDAQPGTEDDALSLAYQYADEDSAEDGSGAAAYGAWDGEPFDPAEG